ncbi:Transporter [Caenorhabditis elegans]|uniref:Transporter n=1 Tax=Caenorhabditis elegans TaxID=6239 RepID=P90890_CAEEL|nr:Transporter [Caenorhabditis elegans]CAB03142.2 Transporter [Caenorhabditis elegans]|eukprot:NP_492396.2 Transporter [Caenorhabditis elegans]
MPTPVSTKKTIAPSTMKTTVAPPTMRTTMAPTTMKTTVAPPTMKTTRSPSTMKTTKEPSMTQTTKTVQSTITNPVSFLDSEVTAKEYVKDGGAARKAYRDAIQVENTDRQAFRGIESLLSSLGQAIGLGNIWRFPTVAYQNGGTSFLIVYIICAFVFAVPAIHMEFALGQYAAKSPPAVFRRIMPALEGVGWMTCIVGAVIGVYYMILISWIVLYIINIFYVNNMGRCDNPWNQNNCYDGSEQSRCNKGLYSNMTANASSFLNTTMAPLMSSGSKRILYINGKCQDATNMSVEVGTEQFFSKSVIRPSAGFTDFNSINLPILGAVALCWVIAAVVLIRGMKAIGKLSYVTVILPYFIIVSLLICGVSLPGAKDGLYHLFGQTDFNYLYKRETWTAALQQICFSLSIGQGGLMNIASYNKKTYNWYRDVYIIVFLDTLMSILGGITVFSTLGFLAYERGINSTDIDAFNHIVKEGHALAFIVYTEAIAEMPVPYLWYALFFIMLFLLGISTEVVIVEIVCSCLADRFRYLRERRWLTVLSVSAVFFLLGLVMTTDAGFYWFDMFDEYSTGISATFGTAIMCMTVFWCYGTNHFREDIAVMWGEPESWLATCLGPAAYFWTLIWKFVTPVCSLLMMGLWIWEKKYPHKGDGKIYPPVFDALGWFIAVVPFLVIPGFAIAAVINTRRMNIPIRGAFMLQKQHPSYDRISEQWPEWKKAIGDKLPEQEPGDDDLNMIDGLETKESDSLIE